MFVWHSLSQVYQYFACWNKRWGSSPEEVLRLFYILKITFQVSVHQLNWPSSLWNLNQCAQRRRWTCWIKAKPDSWRNVICAWVCCYVDREFHRSTFAPWVRRQTIMLRSRRVNLYAIFIPFANRKRISCLMWKFSLKYGRNSNGLSTLP